MSRYSKPKTREEYLLQARTVDEVAHRHLIYSRGVRLTYEPCVQHTNDLELPISNFYDTCNKSVPLYIIDATCGELLKTVLHNYIYHRWFRPYRSEIDHGRFICKFIAPRHLPNDDSPPTPSTIETIISLNRALCTTFEVCRLAHDETLTARPFYDPAKDKCLLQPLFKALLIVLSAQDYELENSKTVGKLPVFLVRTGIEDGLSAPITFEPIADKMRIGSYDGEAIRTIRTTLETAIDFVMELEAREVAAFGYRPSPTTSWPSLKPPEDAEDIGANKPVTGPSSQFVDTERYKQWEGDGAHYDSVIAPEYEERAFRNYARWEERRRLAREEAAAHGEPKLVQ